MQAQLLSARTRFVLFAVVLITLFAMGPLTGQQQIANAGIHASTGPNQVVQLSTTDVGFGQNSLDASWGLAGKTVIDKTPAEWATMSTADFASYDAVVLNDPTCEFRSDTAITAAKANAATWGAAIDGNVIITGTDEQFHSVKSKPYRDRATAFVVADPAKTGGWVSLSCYYDDPTITTQTWLGAAFGGTFSVSGTDCLDNVHLVATHPALIGLTDAQMSGWGCSLHERFHTWPNNFEVLAIDLNGAAVFTAPDGTEGTPYILARGVTVISDIDLAPEDDVNIVGTTHTVTATVTVDDPVPGTPVVGTLVTFNVIAGPNAGDNGTDTTDANGEASFTYTGNGGVGTDIIEATFVDGDGNTQRSNRVEKEWVRRNCMEEVTWDPVPGSFVSDPAAVPFGPAGTFRFDAKMTNIGADHLLDLVSPVVTLSPDNRILNYPESPATVGDTLTLPLIGDYADGVLSPGEMATFTFVVGLDPKAPFSFFVDLECVPRGGLVLDDNHLEEN